MEFTSPAQLQTALQIGDSKGGKSVLSILEVKFLRALRHQNLGLYLTAQAINPGTLVPGGTALFRKVVMTMVKDYDATGGNKQVPQVETLSVLLNQTKSILYEVESIDLHRYFKEYEGNEEIANAILATLSETSINSIKAHLDCTLIKQIVSAATANSNVINVSELAKLDKTSTRDNSVAAYAEFAPVVNKLEKTVSAYTLGVSRHEIFGVMDPNAIDKLALASATLYGATANDVDLLTEKLGFAPAEAGDFGGIMGGIPLYRTIFLDRALATTTDQQFSSDSFDFTDVIGMVFHKEAVAMPMSSMISAVNKNYNNDNFVFIHKFNYGIDNVRGSLAYVFKRSKTPSA